MEPNQFLPELNVKLWCAKQFRLTKTYLDEPQSKVSIEKYLPTSFPIV